jgi:hypothetical protein
VGTAALGRPVERSSTGLLSVQGKLLFDTQRRLCKIERLIFLIGGRKAAAATKSSCHRGGIGRRAWFRSMYSQGCGGSSPFDGTKFFQFIDFLLLFSVETAARAVVAS